MSTVVYNESDRRTLMSVKKSSVYLGYFTITFNLLWTESAYFPPSVDMSCWMADCNSTNHFSMVKLVYLSGVSWDTWSNQSIWWKWHSLHLTIATNIEWVCRFASRRAWWKAWSKWRHANSCSWSAVFKTNLSNRTNQCNIVNKSIIQLLSGVDVTEVQSRPLLVCE